MWGRLRMSVDAWAAAAYSAACSGTPADGTRSTAPSKPFARFSFAWLNERELPEAVKRMAAARPVAQIKRSIQFRNCNAAGF
jgi:DNA-binding transcriptional MocR family regulator